ASWENPDGTKVTVEIQETVTVPAGSYVAYRLRQRKGETTIVDWFYPAIGLIKEQSDQAVVELMSLRTEPITTATPAPTGSPK
ncbi:MAG: hypothetical protein H7338_12120, partial [Candidatus Sericytochromatia bacterium]|nr:hypothetical protein [Candidatus Sericytochromatia bacterium]